MWKISKYIAILFFIPGIFFNVFALENVTTPEQIRLNYITSKEGLPQNTVDCILKDSQGFMWFGTWNGLCRFDGYNFTIFNKDHEGISLPGNFIQTLCEDNKGNIWVGTEQGLALFDYSKFSFVALPGMKDNLGKYSITHIVTGRNNNMYVATAGNGLWKIEEGEETGYMISCISEGIPSPEIHHLCLLEDNHLLAGTSNGLAIINTEGKTTLPPWNKLKQTLEGIDISIIYQDSGKNIWIGTSASGLYHFESNTMQMSRYEANDEINSLNHQTVYAIIEDLSGNIIVGTLGGLNYFDPAKNNFKHFPENSETHKFLNNPFVNSLYADEPGNIWIGTEKGGINHYNTFQKLFFALKNDPTNKNSISHNTINSIYKEGNTLWVGTAGGGLNKLTHNHTINKRFIADPGNPLSITSNFISALSRDLEGNFWVGTWGGGLNLLIDENRNYFNPFLHSPNDSATLCNNFISCIETLDPHRLLIGTRGGIDLFSPSENKFMHIHQRMHLNQPLEVGCILADSDQQIWAGTENGLYRFSKEELLNVSEETDSVGYELFLNTPDDPNSLPGNYVISIFEASDGSIWFGTYGNGICTYTHDGSKNKFINYNEKDGLCNNVAYAIEEDLNGNLWISTDNGLSKFDPHSKKFQNFYQNDGLLSDQFYWSSSFADKNGTLYFGGIEGLNYFSPEQIEPYPNTPNPVFTEFYIFNNPVSVGEEYHSQVVLEKPISQTEQIRLSHKDAVFSIEFSALDYFLPKKVKYAYKMEGVDQRWVEVDANRRFANYTNLSGGEYIFRVKASNSDGVWSEKTARLEIEVIPPFWEKAWFQVFAVMVISLLVMAYIHYRTRFFKIQKRKLEVLVHERTNKIEEQKEELELQADNLKKTNQKLEERQILIEGQKVELEKQNQQIASQRDEVIELNKKVNLVNQLRLRFFTNISHEFRTPLTLIIDPLEQLQDKYKNDKNTSNTLAIINRNAQRLLHLINQLIYFRKIETGKLKLNVSKGDLVDFLQEIFSSFSDLAENQGITYEFMHNKTEKETWFDSEKTENVFYNLLSNAFKFTPMSGSIKMIVDFVEQSNQEVIPAPFVSVSIMDSGQGIEAKHLPRLFDRFYKAEQNKRDTDFTSSGIGLALTYEIVQALHGKINVESTPGKGSRFTVYLPFTKDAFEIHELNENAVPANINIEGRIKVLSDHIVARESGYEKDGEVTDDKNKPTVLIVEDNFDMRSFLLQTLRSDYRVLGAENGKIGLEMAKKYSPELIVSDVMMPVMDGMELCSRLKKTIQTSHIPVILLTAKNLIENWIEGLETGADDYIPKPFNLQILQIKMRNLIEMRRKIKELFSSPENVEPNQLSNNAIDEDFISKAYSILEKNYDRKDFSTDQFANEMCVSRSLLYKKIKALTDLNIIDFINSYKLKKSVAIMRKNNVSISEVAFASGFNDPKYFSRIFKKFYGVCPSEFAGVNITL